MRSITLALLRLFLWRRVTERWGESGLGERRRDAASGKRRAAAPANISNAGHEREGGLFVEGRAENPRFGC